MGHDLLEVVANDQPITLQVAQRARQHPLRNTVHPTADIGMAKLPIDAERVNDAERPAIASMSQNFSPQAVIVISEAITHRLGILKDVVPA